MAEARSPPRAEDSSSDDTETDYQGGVTTDVNGAVNTDETFDDTDSSTFADNFSESTTGNNNGTTYTIGSSGGNAGNERDTTDGTIDGGVTTDNYSDVGGDTITAARNSSFDYTGTDTGGGSHDYHGTMVYTGKQTQTESETGDYTTKAPGAPAITPTTHNPNGYAISDQAITLTETIANNETDERWGSNIGANSSNSGSGTYTRSDGLTYTSSSTVDVNLARKLDTESGGYNTNAWEKQHSNYIEQGNSSSRFVNTVWTASHVQDHQGTSNDSDTYGQPEVDSLNDSTTQTDSGTKTDSYKNPDGVVVASVSSIFYIYASNGGGYAISISGAAVPIDSNGGGAPVTHGPYTPVGAPPRPVDESPSRWSQALDRLQGTLDVAGLVPGAGAVPDAISGVISAGRGDWTGAGLSLVAMVPFLGEGAGALKIARRGAKTFDKLKSLADGNKALDRAADLAKHSDDAFNHVAKRADGAIDNAAKAADETAPLSKWNKLTPEQLKSFPGCFFAGTLVSTELTEMPIERVARGNRAWAFDLRKCRWELCEVLETYEIDYVGEAVELRVAGMRVDSTYHHPYWVIEGENLELRPRPEHIEAAWESNASLPGRWIDAGDLLVGDVLLLRDGRRAPIEAVCIRHVATKVYNFQVAGLHNYAVGVCGVLVHNNSMRQPPKAALDALPGKAGKTGPIKEVPDEKALTSLYDRLTDGAKTVNPGTYPGVVKELPDGTIIRMRPKSKSGGSALDITLPDGTIYKVHVL